MEDNQDDNPQNNRMAMFGPPRTDDSQTIIWKIDPEDVIDEIAHYLRGDTWDSKENNWKTNKDKERRLCNELGISVFTSHLRGVLNKNIILSKMDEDMINKMAVDNALTVIKLIYTCYDKFDIKKQNFGVILQIMDTNVYATLRRSLDGFFVNHLSTTQRYIEQSRIGGSEPTEQKKKGIFSVLGWG